MARKPDVRPAIDVPKMVHSFPTFVPISKERFGVICLINDANIRAGGAYSMPAISCAELQWLLDQVKATDPWK